MNRRNPAWVDVDELIQSASIGSVLRHYGLAEPATGSGEHRMPCPFNDACSDSSYGSLTVNLDDPSSRIFTHCCGVRGNLLTLLFGLENQRQPTGGKLRGDEFKQTVRLLRSILDGGLPGELSRATEPRPEPQPASQPPKQNIPLKDQEKTKALVDLWTELETDPANMPPEAARYFRSRPWLTPEVCRTWRMGYLPRSGRSLLRGCIVYAHRNEAGDIISYSGRDPRYEAKKLKWIKDGKPETKKPIKHRYVKGFHRGIELYGQQAQRLTAEVRQSLQQYGLIIVEGQNDVIRLDTLGIPAVGLMSSKATTEQIDKICRFTRQLADNRSLLLPDNDPEGQSGCKDLAWELLKRGIDTRVCISDGWKQPEEIAEASQIPRWQPAIHPTESS